MNIFVLDDDLQKNAEYHVDRHVVKMILESAQILSTNVRYHNIDIGYKATHTNHPCTIWARASLSNHVWLLNFVNALHNEWQYRFNHTKNHKSFDLVQTLPIPPIEDIGLTPFAQAMPDCFRDIDAVKAYRQYYIGEKRDLFKWTGREAPYWVDIDGISK